MQPQEWTPATMGSKGGKIQWDLKDEERRAKHIALMVRGRKRQARRARLQKQQQLAQAS